MLSRTICTAILRPSLPKLLIPRPAKGNPSLARPSVLARPPLPSHLGKLPSHIPWPPSVNKGITVFQSEEDLLLHLSTLVPLPNVSVKQETWMPEEPCSAPTTPSTPREELEAESPDSPDSQTSTALYSLCPRLPITYNEVALSHLQGRPQVITCNNLSIPFPSDSECSTDNTDGNTTNGTDDPNGSSAEVEADSSHKQIEWLTAGIGMDTPTPQDIQLTPPEVTEMPPIARKMLSQRHHRFPIGNRSLQDHKICIPGPSSPAHRTTKSSQRTVLLTGPSSSPAQTLESTNRTSSPWTFIKAFTAMLCKTTNLAVSVNIIFEPFQDHEVFILHEGTTQTPSFQISYWLLWWPIWQQQTFKGPLPCPSAIEDIRRHGLQNRKVFQIIDTKHSNCHC